MDRWVERGCISCRAAPVNGPSILCQLCHNDALRVAPVIIEVPEDHDGYKSGMPTTLQWLGVGLIRPQLQHNFRNPGEMERNALQSGQFTKS